ncbi:putative triacylglycerol lipase [Lupinus albus]|uniref:Putative triacylglycerol lipase n=1 Tax=Lupinus albus TaxID=3870 RepID=A0A6A4P7B9_LUPAL|nr:putative triacylglycerol lipase [Lupinus albus]
MATFKVFWVVLLMSQQAFFAKANRTKSLVEALYVFGDSSVDAGNNNNLNTFAKANIYPYGIDFNNKSTGRFTNGKNFADVIAINLGLPLPPPYLGVSESERYKVATGINYASGACGILNDTRDVRRKKKMLSEHCCLTVKLIVSCSFCYYFVPKGDCLSLDKQVEYFNSTVTNDLQKHFQSKDEVQHHLSESLYLLSIGSCDYALNYFRRATYQNKTPVEFADYLLEKLGSKLKELYNMGARKFVVAVAGQLGCSPSEFCDEIKNEKVKPLSDKLPRKLQELQTQLSGSLFISSNPFNFFNEIRKAPEKFGFKTLTKSCYVVGQPICENPKDYYYFDFAHGTEANNELFANECFSGSRLCSPTNIEQLIHAI